MPTTYTPGTYRADITRQGYGESENKRTLFFFFQIKIRGRYDEQGQLQPCPEYERTYTQYIANETGVAILRGDLRALGVTLTDLRLLEPGVTGHVGLVGRAIDVECEHEVYQGRTRERWRIHRPRKKPDLDTLAELNEKFKHLLGGQPGEGSAAPPPNDGSASMPPDSEPTDDGASP